MLKAFDYAAAHAGARLAPFSFDRRDPGHEIVGPVVRIGAGVSKFRVGDTAAVGCLVDSCRACEPCRGGGEHFSVQGPAPTYARVERISRAPTYGGYADNYVVDPRFALKVSEKLDPAAAAPLLCAGLTTYSPLHHWEAGPGKKVGVVGLGDCDT